MESLKILVVEDDPGTLLVLQKMLNKAGHEVMTAEDGHQAVDIVSDRFFDLVITDLSMPGDVDGIGVLEEVKEKYKQTEVIVMTAYATVETAVEAMKKGAADYLKKPVDFEELNLRLERLSTLKSAIKDASNLREAMNVTEKTAGETIQDLEMMVADLQRMCSEVKKTLADQSVDTQQRVTTSLEMLSSSSR